MSHKIRLVDTSDCEGILNIYAPYVKDTAVSFETEIPDLNEFSARVGNISSKYPFLVYEVDNKIIGYAYASRHRERASYIYDVDVSIYTLTDYHGHGIGNKLYKYLFILLKELGYYNAYAGCTIPNHKSINFHEKFGFTQIGVYRKTGYKFGQWHDVAWFEKNISDYSDKPDRIKLISELPHNADFFYT